MTIFRSLPRPATGLADDPDEIMREFQRIAAHFGKIDQNNVRSSGVERQHIVLPSNSDHEGLSDYLPSSGSLTYASTGAGQTLSMSTHDGAWWTHPGLSLSIRPRTDSWWLIAVGLQGESVFAVGPGNPDYSQLLVRPQVQSGNAISPGTGVFSEQSQHCAIICVAPFFIPAGQSTIHLQAMGRWRGATLFPDIVVQNANMWAVGFYDA
jgi:hypothetical protein